MSNINHPKHYNTGKFEVIDVIKDWNLNFNLGNSIKYIGRAEHKGKKIEDLCKAKWYIEREIQDLECDVSNEKLKQEIDDKSMKIIQLREMIKDRTKDIIYQYNEIKRLEKKLMAYKRELVKKEKVIKSFQNEKENKDNEFRPTIQKHDVNYSSLIQCLNEEFTEWKKSSAFDNEVEELCDIIQCCYNLLDYMTEGELEEKIKLHNQKLKNRGWKFKK